MRFAERVLARPAAVAACLVALSLFALAGIFDPLTGAPRLRIDPSLNEMLPADDPARRFYEELLERFGSDDVVVVGLISDALFTRDGLETFERTSEALARAPGVQRVESLATAVRMRPIEDDVEISGFFDDPIGSDAAACALQEALLDDPLRAGSFISVDGRATAILVTFERVPEDEFLARGLDLGVLEVARAEATDMQVVMAGTPHVKAEVGRLLEVELAIMVPIVFALMSLLSCLFFRSVRLGLVPLAAVATGLLWTVGVMGWVGHDLNIVTTLIPPLVLALGFAYATHVVAGFAADGEGGPARAQARRALAHAVFPVTFTALTTAAGFLSLTSNGLSVIRGFGIFAAVSTASTLLASLTLVPLLLSLERSGATAGANPTTDFPDACFAALARFDARHAVPILWVGATLVGCAAFFATKIEVNLPVIENFREDAEIRRAYETVDALFGGANQFFVMLRAEERRAFEDTALLREVDAFLTENEQR